MSDLAKMQRVLDIVLGVLTFWSMLFIVFVFVTSARPEYPMCFDDRYRPPYDWVHCPNSSLAYPSAGDMLHHLYEPIW